MKPYGNEISCALYYISRMYKAGGDPDAVASFKLIDLFSQLYPVRQVITDQDIDLSKIMRMRLRVRRWRFLYLYLVDGQVHGKPLRKKPFQSVNILVEGNGGQGADNILEDK